MSYPTLRKQKQNPYGVVLTVFLFYCVYGRVFVTVNLRKEIHLFEILKMFHPPKGLCEAEPECGSFDSIHFIVSGEGVFDTFNLSAEICRFEKLKIFPQYLFLHQ